MYSMIIDYCLYHLYQGCQDYVIYNLYYYILASQNGTSSMANTISSSQLEHNKQETDNEHDSETTSQISATLLDISNLVIISHCNYVN